MSTFETRPGGEAAKRSNDPKAKSRREAVLAEASEEDAEVEQRAGKVTIKRKKAKK